MQTKQIHNFNLKTEKEFDLIQQDLSSRIFLTNKFTESSIKLCSGVDLAYFEKGNIQYAVCSIVVIDYNTKEVVEKVSSSGIITVPYIAGYLAFRELPLIIEATKKLSTEPDIFMFDGNGYLHFNHMGIATHASFFLDKPTIGVAKTYLKIKNTDYIEPQNNIGSYTDIVIDKQIYGRVLRTRQNIKPIFISCGNYIDLDTTASVIMNFINDESRLPMPTRLADLETHKLRADIINTTIPF